ncbi:translation initiation factor eIF-2B subunit epsilon-like [Photinus pyralis]|uniref:translation initiation factor eIF-2B subunit epsilon-like n=1 Tax=Photinus pyralis TaxID=7054 RepID=UPI0012672859|nr:translation initiation factor eIF-2B subunit epsilon-like [Photinus pyralis]
MSQKLDKSVAQKEVVQAVVIAEHFGNEFMPITDDTPLTLLPLLNVPLLEYTLEFLSLGGIEETFLFCCSNVVMIKQHINSSIEKSAGWSLTMKVHVIVSETCRSFGDCIRDLDAKALIRGDFVLLEPGIVGNIKLLPIIKKHNETCNTDKGAAMTLILQEAGLGQRGRCSFEEVLMVATPNNRVLLHQKLGTSKKAKIELPLEILMDNASVNIYHNLKDTHISICSPNVLSLFSDNFDFQTKDDFVRGLLINEEILGSTIYWHLIKGNQYGAAVTNWRMYQSVRYSVSFFNKIDQFVKLSNIMAIVSEIDNFQYKISIYIHSGCWSSYTTCSKCSWDYCLLQLWSWLH